MTSIPEEVSDLSKLDNLDTGEILHQLKRRFLNGQIYTYIGDVLVAINPYEDVPDLYNTELLTHYQTARDPPHIYWTAEQTYKRLQHEQSNQCIIVTGDSGAGKTESTKHILRHLINRSPCDVGNLVEKLNHINPLIELFGNASTVLNRNSSRFGKLIELSYNADGSLTGGKLKTFILEKSRVVHRNPKEKNFHVFHALFAGCLDQELRDKYYLEQQNEYRIMLGDDQMPHIHYDGFINLDAKHKYKDIFEHGLTILKEIGFCEEDITQIINVLAACLHLGNIEFDVVDDRTDGVAIRHDEHLLNAIPLLGLQDTAENVAELNESLISRPIIAQGQTILRPYSQIQADNVRNSVVKGLYAGAFKAVIDQINKCIEGNTFVSRSRQYAIGILDISGFEILSENSLEQLFINITNEQIHQFHQHQIFKVENREYTDEGIHLPPNSFHDNTVVLDLIFMSPGILSLLDDQTKLDNENDAHLVTDYNSHLCHKSDVYKQCRSKKEFGIIHFAGEVIYSTEGFLAKNQGTIPERIKGFVIEKSENYIVSTYFDVSDNFTSQRHGLRGTISKQQARDIRDRYHMLAKTSNDGETMRSKPKVTNSTASQFRKSLSSLINILTNAKPLFVRCIKPNTMQQMKKFDDKVVLAQLKSSGIIDVVRIRRDGYQVRVTFDNFCKWCDIIRKETLIPVGANDHHNVLNIINACNIDRDAYRIGHSKVFLKGHAMEKIYAKIKELFQKRKEQEEEERLKAEQEHEHQQELKRLHENEDHFLNESDSERTESTRESLLNPKLNQSTVSSGDSENQSLNSHPPTYSDIEQERKREQNRVAWDSFRNTERDYDSCVETENCFIKFCRLLMCIGLFIGILISGACTILIPLVKVSQLNSDNDVTKRSLVVTELIMCYSIPIALTFIQSLFKVCLGRVKNVSIKYFMPVLIIESIEVCGTAYFLFKVLPKHSTTSGITFILTTFLCPSVLNIQKHIVLAKHRHKFIFRLLSVIVAVTVVVIQYGVLICICVDKDIVMSDGKSQMPEYSIQETIFLVGSMVAISLGYCKNFLTCNIKLGSLRINLKDWRMAVEKARPKINFKMCIVKVGVFLGMTKILVPDASWTFTNDNSQSSTQQFVKFLDNHKLMFIYILCAIYINYAGQLACKLHLQRISFYIPLILVPVVCFGGVFGYCYQWPNGTDILDGVLVCPSIEIDKSKSGIGLSVGLWISLILLTRHVLFLKCHRMEKAERLFDLPTRDSFFSSFGLLLKRKDDVIEHQLLKHAKFKLHEENNTMPKETRYDEQRRQKKKHIRPYVYVCVTMWHETRTEMLQLLKSLFRLDFHRSKCKIAESVFGVDVDYFEHEIHIIIDDAFETDDKSGQQIPNEYVKQLIGCLEEASTSVAKGHVNWDSQPTKISTPYGGRLSWIMPGGTQMFFHMKDKQKIRIRKRWSQVLYMYYLLGYKQLGTVTEDSLLEKQTHKRYHYRKNTSLLNQLPKDKIKKAHNSFILALDGDVDFKAEAVQKLIDKMTKNDKVGAVCGRIHPIGTGPVVWYQMFEYAIGHWLQKATEHVFGCVLCCPGAFSLFRVSSLMDDNVMRMYATPALEATNYIRMEQGEDRWLSTLLIQQGYKIDYCASADAYTFAPVTFKDFFVQRRRWGPSTLANIVDLLSSWRITTKINDNVSTMFVFYQFTLFATSLLGIGTVTLMITGSFNAVLNTTMLESYVIVLVPIFLYAIICAKCSNDKQIAIAALLSTIYSLVMVIVTVGLLVIFATEKIYSPNYIFFSLIVVIMVTSGIAHPKEITNLFHGLIYYIMIPTSFILLTVYYMCNIHVVSWGTREKGSTESEAVKEMKSTEEKTKTPLQYIKQVAKLVKESIGFIKDMEGQSDNVANSETTSTANPENLNRTRRPAVRQDPNAWQTMTYLGRKEKQILSEDETRFWQDLLHKYLYPMKLDGVREAQIKAELLSLRNNVAFGLLMLNFLFSTAIFQVQNNEYTLRKLYILGEFEPVSVIFLSIFSLIILVQFCGMLIHRYGTFLHLISGMRLWSYGKASENEWVKQALKETEKLQSADPVADMEETVSISDLSEDSNINNNTNGKITEMEPDYPVEEPSADYPEDDIQPKNQYEKNFRRRFATIRHNFKRMSFDINSGTNNTNHNDLNVNRFNLYKKTFTRRAGGRLNRGYF